MARHQQPHISTIDAPSPHTSQYSVNCSTGGSRL